MIATDTNALLRYLLGDDPAQSSTVVRCFHREFEGGGEVFVSDIVLVEACWVLESAYEMDRTEIADVLDQVVGRRSFVLESRRRVKGALAGYRSTKADFSDLMILLRAMDEGATVLCTFDKALLRHDGAEKP